MGNCIVSPGERYMGVHCTILAMETCFENFLHERKKMRGKKNGNTLHSIDYLHWRLNGPPFWVSIPSLVDVQTLSPQAAEYTFFWLIS